MTSDVAGYLLVVDVMLLIMLLLAINIKPPSDGHGAG